MHTMISSKQSLDISYFELKLKKEVSALKLTCALFPEFHIFSPYDLNNNKIYTADFS